MAIDASPEKNRELLREKLLRVFEISIDIKHDEKIDSDFEKGPAINMLERDERRDIKHSDVERERRNHPLTIGEFTRQILIHLALNGKGVLGWHILEKAEKYSAARRARGCEKPDTNPGENVIATVILHPVRNPNTNLTIKFVLNGYDLETWMLLENGPIIRDCGVIMKWNGPQSILDAMKHKANVEKDLKITDVINFENVELNTLSANRNGILKSIEETQYGDIDFSFPPLTTPVDKVKGSLETIMKLGF